MKKQLRDFARVGLVHHLLYPKCAFDPDDHARTLEHFVQTLDFDIFDCCLPFGDDRRKRLIQLINASGKPRVYATHMFPMQKLSPTSTNQQEQGIIRVLMQDQIDMAAAIHAEGMLFVSGADTPKDQRAEAKAAFGEFCRWFCHQLKAHGMIAMLEPSDRDFDKRFLYGPTNECVELIQSLEGVDNLGIELDMAHLPLMDETFEEAIKTSLPYLKRVHLGNCVLGDQTDPFYGDKHPPIGYPGGEIDIPQLAEIFKCLLDVGYLNEANPGKLVLEIQSFPGRSPEATVADNMQRLETAWAITRS